MPKDDKLVGSQQGRNLVHGEGAETGKYKLPLAVAYLARMGARRNHRSEQDNFGHSHELRACPSRAGRQQKDREEATAAEYA